jgi:hypothetical protein
MTKQIQLTKGYVALVSDVDADLAELKWMAQETHGRVYAYRKVGSVGKRETVYMHRVVLARKLGRPLRKGELTDHEKGIGLDNRRDNLRPASNAENARNQGKNKVNTSGYKGVSWHNPHQKWVAQIKVNKKPIHLGYFPDPALAARAYDAAAIEHHGEFAQTNF